MLTAEPSHDNSKSCILNFAEYCIKERPELFLEVISKSPYSLTRVIFELFEVENENMSINFLDKIATTYLDLMDKKEMDEDELFKSIKEYNINSLKKMCRR